MGLARMAKVRIPFPSRPPCLTAVAYENVCKCRGVAIGAKLNYLRAISACGADASSAEAAHKSETKGKARTGPDVADLVPDEGLGVLIEESAFIKYVSPSFGKSVAKFRNLVNAMVAYYEKRESGKAFTDLEKLAALSFMNTPIPPRTDGSIWFFRNPTRARDPFAGLLNEWLGHRLGLDVSASGETRLAFGFLAGHVNDAHHPTFYDTTWSYLKLWDYRGTTRPLPRTPAGLTGLEEVVALPPEIGRTSRPIVRIKLSKR